MGYETELIFIQDWNRKKGGFKQILARVEMGKICYNEFSKLLEKSKKEATVKQAGLLSELNDIRGDLDDATQGESDFDRDWIKKANDNLWKVENKLEKSLPMIFARDDQSFEDSYGDLLIIVSLDDLYRAIMLDSAKELSNYKNPKGYRRYNLALKMIENFMDTEFWAKGNVKVVLWGH